MKSDSVRQQGFRFAATALICLCLQSTAVAAGSSEAVAPGAATTQSMSLADIDGRQHKLSDYRGKVVLLNFWTSWCPPCVREMPALARLSGAMAGRPFALLAINVAEGRGVVQRFARVEESGIELLMDTDGRMAKAWGVSVYPTSVIVDGAGRVVETIVGETDWDTQAIYDRLEALIRGTEKVQGN